MFFNFIKNFDKFVCFLAKNVNDVPYSFITGTVINTLVQSFFFNKTPKFKYLLFA